MADFLEFLRGGLNVPNPFQQNINAAPLSDTIVQWIKQNPQNQPGPIAPMNVPPGFQYTAPAPIAPALAQQGNPDVDLITTLMALAGNVMGAQSGAGPIGAPLLQQVQERQEKNEATRLFNEKAQREYEKQKKEFEAERLFAKKVVTLADKEPDKNYAEAAKLLASAGEGKTALATLMKAQQERDLIERQKEIFGIKQEAKEELLDWQKRLYNTPGLDPANFEQVKSVIKGFFPKDKESQIMQKARSVVKEKGFWSGPGGWREDFLARIQSAKTTGQVKPATTPSIQEVPRKLPDGRIGIFNAQTKQFIRYQD